MIGAAGFGATGLFMEREKDESRTWRGVNKKIGG